MVSMDKRLNFEKPTKGHSRLVYYHFTTLGYVTTRNVFERSIQ